MPKPESILALHMGLVWRFTQANWLRYLRYVESGGGNDPHGFALVVGKVTAKLSDLEPTDASELLEDWRQCHTT